MNNPESGAQPVRFDRRRSLKQEPHSDDTTVVRLLQKTPNHSILLFFALCFLLWRPIVEGWQRRPTPRTEALLVSIVLEAIDRAIA